MWGNARIYTKISIYIQDKCFKTVKHTGSDPMSCQISSVHHHHFFSHCSTGMWWNEKNLSDSLILCNSQSGKQQQSITLQFVLPNLRVMSGENVSINFIDFLINAHYEFWCQQQVESKLGQAQQKAASIPQVNRFIDNRGKCDDSARNLYEPVIAQQGPQQCLNNMSDYILYRYLVVIRGDQTLELPSTETSSSTVTVQMLC